VGSQLVGPLLFGSSTATDLTTFVNGIDLNNTGTAAGRTITVTAGTGGDAAIMSGVLRNTNAAGSLTKTGTGILVLNAANTYTGGSTVSGGVLQFANTSAMPATGIVNVNSGGTLGVNAGGGGSEWTNSTNPSDPASIAGLMQNGTGGQGTANQVIWASGSSLGIDTTNAGAMTYSGPIGQFYTGGAPIDAVGLNKLGSGTLTIDNTGNTATGTHAVTAGTLALGNSEVIADSAPVSVSAAGIFDMGGFNENIGSLAGAGAVTLSGALTTGHANSNTTYSGVASGNGSITKVGTGTLTLSGASTYAGTTTINAGIVSVTNATGLGVGNTTAGTGTTVNSGGTLQVSGGITINERIAVNGTGSTGSNGAIRKTGNNTTVLHGQLTGTGSIIATAGTLRFTQSSTDGSNSGFTGPITATGGAVIRFEFISPNQLGQNNVITLDNGTLRNDNGSVPGNGSMFSSTQTMVLGAGGGTLDYNTAGGLSIVNGTSVISGTGGLTKTGVGNIGVASANTYGGPTHVVAGFLKVRTSNERFPNGSALTIDSGATFDLDSLTETMGSLAGAGTLEINAGLFNAGGDNTSTTFSGQINGTGGRLTKQGSGTLTLTGDNIQTGLTTVSAGTLMVNNTTGSGTGTGAVTVASAGTLGGTGSVTGLITNNGKIAPGDGVTVGTFHANGGVTNAASAHLAIELSGATSDVLAVTGNLDLSAADFLDISGAGTGSSWVIGTYTGTLTGTFDTVTSGYTVDYSTLGQIILNASAPSLPGDFNSDGKVDAGDYVTWKKNDGTNNALANDNGLGVPIGANHYNLWRANFGNPPGAGSSGGALGGAAVPEPGTASLLLICAAIAALWRPSIRR
jgi:autotransporter-associated beta strand protein